MYVGLLKDNIKYDTKTDDKKQSFLKYDWDRKQGQTWINECDFIKKATSKKTENHWRNEKLLNIRAENLYQCHQSDTWWFRKNHIQWQRPEETFKTLIKLVNKKHWMSLKMWYFSVIFSKMIFCYRS